MSKNKIERMILYCPECNKQHVDVDEWATTPHHVHFCIYCGHTWDHKYISCGIEGSNSKALKEHKTFNRGFNAGKNLLDTQIKYLQSVKGSHEAVLITFFTEYVKSVAEQRPVVPSLIQEVNTYISMIREQNQKGYKNDL